MLPGTSLPKPLQQALGDKGSEATQAAITAFPQYTHPDLCALQQNDPVLQEILIFWRQKRRPTHQERKNLSQPALVLLKQWDRLVEQDGVLYRQVFLPGTTEGTLQVLLPAALQEEVLTEVHQRHGHQGVERTLELLRPRCYCSKLAAPSERERVGSDQEDKNETCEHPL